MGYDFQNIIINPGESKTFVLDQGMSGGNTNVNVYIVWRCLSSSANYLGLNKNISTNFTDGQTTTITAVNCHPSNCRKLCFE